MCAEIQRLPLTKVIVKLRNCPFPIFGKRLDYRKMWRWRGLWDRWEATPQGFTQEPQPPERFDPVPQATAHGEPASPPPACS